MLLINFFTLIPALSPEMLDPKFKIKNFHNFQPFFVINQVKKRGGRFKLNGGTFICLFALVKVIYLFFPNCHLHKGKNFEHENNLVKPKARRGCLR